MSVEFEIYKRLLDGKKSLHVTPKKAYYVSPDGTFYIFVGQFTGMPEKDILDQIDYILKAMVK